VVSGVRDVYLGFVLEAAKSPSVKNAVPVAGKGGAKVLALGW
jgi:hypothetical protein